MLVIIVVSGSQDRVPSIGFLRSGSQDRVVPMLYLASGARYVLKIPHACVIRRSLSAALSSACPYSVTSSQNKRELSRGPLFCLNKQSHKQL